MAHSIVTLRWVTTLSFIFKNYIGKKKIHLNRTTLIKMSQLISRTEQKKKRGISVFVRLEINETADVS